MNNEYNNHYGIDMPLLGVGVALMLLGLILSLVM